MKTTLLLLALCLAAVPVFAGARRNAGNKGQAAKARLEQLLAHPGPKLLEKFDADKNGSLSSEEQTTVREAIRERLGSAREKVLGKFDANSDGKLDESERSHARETVKHRAGEFRRRVLQRFDADKDGRLNDSERAAAKAALDKVLDGMR